MILMRTCVGRNIVATKGGISGVIHIYIYTLINKYSFLIFLPPGRYGTFNTLKRCAWPVREFWVSGQPILSTFVGVIFLRILLYSSYTQINIEPPHHFSSILSGGRGTHLEL